MTTAPIPVVAAEYCTQADHAHDAPAGYHPVHTNAAMTELAAAASLRGPETRPQRERHMRVLKEAFTGLVGWRRPTDAQERLGTTEPPTASMRTKRTGTPENSPCVAARI